MIAPFPYFGGKGRPTAARLARLGDASVYVEPFAGSLAVLLHRAVACPREIVCDTNGFIANFWRALRADPLGVAWWADYPTIHHDLMARHRWLLAWAASARRSDGTSATPYTSRQPARGAIR